MYVYVSCNHLEISFIVSYFSGCVEYFCPESRPSGIDPLLATILGAVTGRGSPSFFLSIPFFSHPSPTPLNLCEGEYLPNEQTFIFHETEHVKNAGVKLSKSTKKEITVLETSG